MPIKRLLPLKGVSVLFAAAPFSIFNVVGFVPYRTRGVTKELDR
jgi:hypothetical protein